MRLNKIMMKICVDTELCLHELGHISDKRGYQLSKFAVSLHKSI